VHPQLPDQGPGVGRLIHEHAVVAAEEVVVDGQRPLGPETVTAVGAGRTGPGPDLRLLADAVEGGGARIVAEAQVRDRAAVGQVRALDAGAGAEARLVALAVIGPAAGVGLALDDVAAVGHVGARRAGAGADARLVALAIIGPAAAVVAAQRGPGAGLGLDRLVDQRRQGARAGAGVRLGPGPDDVVAGQFDHQKRG